MREALLKSSGYLCLIGGSVLLALVAAVVHPLASLMLMVLAWGAYLGIRYPIVFLLLFLVMLLSRITEFHPEIARLSTGKIFMAASIGFLFLAKIVDRDLTFVQSKHTKWLLILMVVVLMSSVVSTDREQSFEFFTEAYIKVIIFFLIAINLVTSPKHGLLFQFTVALVITGLGVYAIWLSMYGTNLVEGTRASISDHGSLGDPNDLALVFLIIVPFLVTGFLDTRGWVRLAFLLMSIAVIGGIVATQSRGGTLALVAGLGVLLYKRIKSKVVLFSLLGAVLVGVVLFSGMTERRSGGMEELSGGIDESAEVRLVAWGAGARMTYRNPILGVGFGMFPDNYLRYQRGTPIWQPIDAHNSFIKALAETGFLGFIPWMMLVYLTLRGGWRMQNAKMDDPSVLVNVIKKSSFASQISVLVAMSFISHCWTFFVYIVHAQAAIWINILDLDKEDTT